MSAKTPPYGSVEWFVDTRIQVYDQAIALFHIHNSIEYAAKLREHIAKSDELISSALFKAMVIDYGKPFSSSRGVRTYAFNSIKNSKGIDPEAHQELISLRNKLIAHQDEDYTDKVLLTVCATTNRDGKFVSFPVAHQFSGLFLASVVDAALLQKYLSHMEACRFAIGEKAAGLLEIFRDGVANNFDNFQKFYETPRVRARGEPIIPAGNPVDIPALRYTVDLNLPGLKNKNGFQYRIFSLNYTKNGIIYAKDEEGNTHEITISGMEIFGDYDGSI